MLIAKIHKQKIISCWIYDPLKKIGGETSGFIWSVTHKEKVEGFDVYDYSIQIEIKETGGIIYQTFHDIKSNAELISTVNMILETVDERVRKESIIRNLSPQ